MYMYMVWSGLLCYMLPSYIINMYGFYSSEQPVQKTVLKINHHKG